jgi:hypothetical protein
MFVRALLGSLICIAGEAEATVVRAPMAMIDPHNRIQLPRAQRIELEAAACIEHPTTRRELLVSYRMPEDHSLLAFVRCHERPDSDGEIPVKDIRCEKAEAAAWRCWNHTSNYRIDYGRHYILVDSPQLTVDIAGAEPDRYADAVATILASEPRRLNGKSCEMPKYQDGVYEIECDGVPYAVKRTCDDKGCRRTVRRRTRR